MEPVPATTLSAPLGNAPRGRLVFERGLARHVTIVGGAPRGLLYEAQLRDPVPDAQVSGGEVRLDYRPFRTWFRRHEPALMRLASGIPWTIEVRGGAANLELDAREFRLEALDVAGGLADSTVTLGKLDAAATVRVRGGVAWLRVRRPEGIPARVHVTGGAAGLALDRQRLGAIGGESAIETPGYQHDKPRVDVEITGGAANVEVTTGA